MSCFLNSKGSDRSGCRPCQDFRRVLSDLVNVSNVRLFVFFEISFKLCGDLLECSLVDLLCSRLCCRFDVVLRQFRDVCSAQLFGCRFSVLV